MSNQIQGPARKPGRYIQQPNDHKFPTATGSYLSANQQGLFLASGEEPEDGQEEVDHQSHLIEDHLEIESKPEKRLVIPIVPVNPKRKPGRPRIKPVLNTNSESQPQHQLSGQQHAQSVVEETEKPKSVPFQKKYFLPGSTIATTPKPKSGHESNPSAMQEEMICQLPAHSQPATKEKTPAKDAPLKDPTVPDPPKKPQLASEDTRRQNQLEEKVSSSSCSSQSKHKSNSIEKKNRKASVGQDLQPETKASLNNTTSNASKPTKIIEEKPFRVNDILDKINQKPGKKNANPKDRSNQIKQQTQNSEVSVDSSQEPAQKKATPTPNPKPQAKKQHKENSKSSESADEIEKLEAMNFASQIIKNFDKNKKKEETSEDSQSEAEQPKASQKTVQSKKSSKQPEKELKKPSQPTQPKEIPSNSKRPESISSSDSKEMPAADKKKEKKKPEGKKSTEATQEKKSPAPTQPLKPAEQPSEGKQSKQMRKDKKKSATDNDPNDEELDIVESDSQKVEPKTKPEKRPSDNKNSQMQLEQLPKPEETRKQSEQLSSQQEKKKENKPTTATKPADSKNSAMQEEPLPQQKEPERIGVIPRDRKKKKKYPNPKTRVRVVQKKKTTESSESESDSESSEKVSEVKKNQPVPAHVPQKDAPKPPSIQDMPQTKMLMVKKAHPV